MIYTEGPFTESSSSTPHTRRDLQRSRRQDLISIRQGNTDSTLYAHTDIMAAGGREQLHTSLV